jgi:hypothetical protein
MLAVSVSHDASHQSEGSLVKYRITYQCRSDAKISESEFEVESQYVPTSTDNSIIELAQKDSIKFCKFGLAGIEIVSINPLP